MLTYKTIGQVRAMMARRTLGLSSSKATKASMAFLARDTLARQPLVLRKALARHSNEDGVLIGKVLVECPDADAGTVGDAVHIEGCNPIRTRRRIFLYSP